jgi:hypothetical protein
MCQSPLRDVRATCANTTEPASAAGRAHRQQYVSGRAGIDYAGVARFLTGSRRRRRTAIRLLARRPEPDTEWPTEQVGETIGFLSMTLVRLGHEVDAAQAEGRGVDAVAFLHRCETGLM